jgi:hypothetical protein
VVSYDLSEQVAMAGRFEGALRSLRNAGGSSGSDWMVPGKQAATWFAGGLVLLFCAIWALPHLWRAARRRAHIARVRRQGGSPRDASLLYEQMLERLRRHGIEKPPAITPLEFTRRVPEAERPWVLEFTVAYNAARFGSEADSFTRLMALLEEHHPAA